MSEIYKYIATIFCLIHVSLAVISQNTYYPFIEEGKTFAIADRDGSICGYSAVYRYRFGDEVEIDGVDYRTIEHLNYTSGPPFCPPFTAESDWSNTGFLVRENTDEQKVFLKLGSDQEEFLLYDFGLEVGDVISSPFTFEENYELVSIEDVTLLNGSAVQKFTFDGAIGNEPFFYIEGIGSRCSTFGEFGEAIGFYSELLCVEVFDELIYDGNCSGFVLETDEEKVTSISIYPNPTEDFVNISFEQSAPLSAQILDTTGKEIYSVHLTNSPYQLNLSTLNPGVYFIILNSGAGKVGVEQIVVNRGY